MLSIIIPIYNEATLLIQQRDYYLNLKNKAEVIFVDGGSTDVSAAVAEQYGRVIYSPKGRAVQKNNGALKASGDMLMFLHVDTYITDRALDALHDQMNMLQAGCFRMAIMDERSVFRLYEDNVNRRAENRHIIDGDLGLFVKKEIFQLMHGFKLLSVMDDVEFSERLREICEVTVLPQKISVSARRWDEHGFIPTLWRYSMAYFKYHTGISIF